MNIMNTEKKEGGGLLSYSIDGVAGTMAGRQIVHKIEGKQCKHKLKIFCKSVIKFYSIRSCYLKREPPVLPILQKESDNASKYV